MPPQYTVILLLTLVGTILILVTKRRAKTVGYSLVMLADGLTTGIVIEEVSRTRSITFENVVVFVVCLLLLAVIVLPKRTAQKAVKTSEE